MNPARVAAQKNSVKKRRLINHVFVVPVLLAFSALAQGPGKVRVQERVGNAALMDDDFEYAVTDYGLGKIQVRPADNKDSLSPQVFWVKFRIVNKSAHLIQNPRYFASLVIDNWGNSYTLRNPQTVSIQGKIIGGTPPIPENEKRDYYKPGDSSWGLKIVPASEFVNGITELWLDFANFLRGRRWYFKIANPLFRQKNLLREQSDPEPLELQITVVTQTLPPIQAPITKQMR